MILENLLNSQELILIGSKFKNKYSFIFDVALYGSAVRGNTAPNDIDFAILTKEKLKEDTKLNIAQELKQVLFALFPKKQISVEVVSIADFSDSDFLARQGIIGESYLIIQRKYLSEIFGFKTFTLFVFNLKGLTHTNKTMFRYALNGRRGNKGVLIAVNGEHIGSGIIKVPIQKTEEFKSFLNQHKINFRIESAMFYSFV